MFDPVCFLCYTHGRKARAKMELMEKLAILGDAAKYDVSCSSSGSRRKGKPGELGNAAPAGICHSWAADGRCISLLKVLQTNTCVYNCAYCQNRRDNDLPRAAFTPEELADLTMAFYRRNFIEGLFVSSAVDPDPDSTMERMIRTLDLLRNTHRFHGYIHIKIIPGASPELIHRAGLLADRVSVNIELPSAKSLRLLAPQKTSQAILAPMTQITEGIAERHPALPGRRVIPMRRPGEKYVPAGQTTQMIVGASRENDYQILKLSEGLYRRFAMKRVYFSAYIPVVSDSRLPAVAGPPLLREHRLYQGDWLLRFYGFSADEILDPQNPDFDTDLDPKCCWALRHLEQFPVEVNRAPYEMLLRVPGIGIRSARRIITARKAQRLSEEHLKKLGVVLKRARHFITCAGAYLGVSCDNDDLIRRVLTDPRLPSTVNLRLHEQLSLFQSHPTLFDPNPLSRVSGEF